MWCVEVETPDKFEQFIAFSAREALERERFERHFAETVYGQDDRDNIHIHVTRLD